MVITYPGAHRNDALKPRVYIELKNTKTDEMKIFDGSIVLMIRWLMIVDTWNKK